MGRRAWLLPVVLLAALGAAGLAVAWLARPDGGGADDGSRARTHATVAAPDQVAAESAPRPAPASDASDATGARAAATTPVREVDAIAEIEFPGMVQVHGAPPDAPPLDGTITFKNADATRPPLHLVVPVKAGRFHGRGPRDAVVEVEQLELAGRTLDFVQSHWELWRQWVPVEAGWSAATLVHVVDAATGEELRHVSVVDYRHDPAVTSRQFIWNWSKPSAEPGSGFDSPLKLSVPEPMAEVAVHVAGYGDEVVRIGEGVLELRVELLRAASLHVVVQPWPSEPTRSWRGELVRVGHVQLARIDGATLTSAASALPPSATASLQAKVNAAHAYQSRADAARRSSLRRDLPIDEHGEATFDDLPGGAYLVWPTASRSIGGDLWSIPLVQDHTLPPVDATTHPGARTEVVLSSRSVVAPTALLRLRAVDAVDGRPLALDADEVCVTPCEIAESVLDAGTRRTRAIIGAGTTGDGALLYEAAAGAYVLDVDPHRHLQIRRWCDFLEMKPGENDVTLSLPRAQGIIVAIVVPKKQVEQRAEWFERVLPKLSRDGKTKEPESFWEIREGEPQRLVQRYALATTTYELVVPADAGYDRSGAFPFEVREGEVTTFELHLTPPADAGTGR